MPDARPVVTIGTLIGEAADPERLIQFHVRYGQKEAHLELPVRVAGREQEQGTEVYRQELQTFLDALQEALRHPTGIQWPYQRQT